jgi:TolB-like protein/tetratricopeptide (TPR) repeat protein
MEHSAATRPSIAVLPFTNMSGDAEQEYFADGIVEEMITALSHLRWLSVIARNSSFTYKGKNVDVKQVGRELGVRYVLEGSVRKSGNRVRITGQLIDAASGAHIWADRFDGDLDDIFDLQDQVTAKVVGAIAPKLEQAEIERAKRKPTDSLDAYDYFLRGMASLHQWTKEANDEALRLFHRATELDPAFASAYGMAAWCYVWRKVNGWMTGHPDEVAETERLARRAVELGGDDAVALSGGGYALVFVVHDLDDGAAFIERALALNPNHAWALHSAGWTKAFLGDPDMAIKHLTYAMQLSPLDPHSFRAQGGIAFAHFLAGRYADAITWAEAALRTRPNYLAAIRELSAACALAGRLPEAQKAMAHLRQIDPAMRVATVKDWVPLRRPDDLERLREGLRLAGLPV